MKESWYVRKSWVSSKILCPVSREKKSEFSFSHPAEIRRRSRFWCIRFAICVRFRSKMVYLKIPLAKKYTDRWWTNSIIVYLLYIFLWTFEIAVRYDLRSWFELICTCYSVLWLFVIVCDFFFLFSRQQEIVHIFLNASLGSDFLLNNLNISM